MTYPELQEQVCLFLHGIDDVTNISTAELNNLTRLIRNGLRRFYYPPQQEGIYDWNFLRQKCTIQTCVGTRDYLQPFDFGGLDGELTHDQNDSVIQPVSKVTFDRIMQLRATNVQMTSWPTYYAERPVHSGGRQSTRYEVMFWPDPDAVYTLYGNMRVLPLNAVSAQPYLYGGVEHSQTILEACLAQAEIQLDGAPGVHAVEFAACLKTSMALDTTMHAPEKLGYNGNRRAGDRSLMRDNLHVENFSAVTYSGGT